MSAERLPILSKTLHDQRRGLALWTLGLATFVALYVPVFSRYRDTGALTAQTDALPEGMQEAFGLDQIATAAGYVQSTVFALLGMLLVLVFAIGFGARVIAGEEEAGTLDLYLAHPLSRRRLVVERALAVTVASVALASVLGTTVWGFATGLSLEIPASGIATASLGLGLLAAGFGTLAITIGGMLGRRAVVLGATAAITLLMYLVYILAPQVSALHGLGQLSPFSWYLVGDPVANGPDWTQLGLLAALPVALTWVATVAFDRRDVST